MPDIGRVLKEEIQRLARKEIKADIVRLRKDNAALKRTAVDLKRRVANLERDNKRLVAESKRGRKQASSTDVEATQSARITAKTIRGIRAKLGLSQAELAKLLGVNPQTVYMWEHKEGRLTFRGDIKTRIVEVRKLKANEAKKRLEDIKTRPNTKAKKKAKRR